MATTATAEQRKAATFRRSQAADNPIKKSSNDAVSNTARSLASGKANRNISADRQLAGEVAARTGQAIGAYFGGVGAPVGQRIGRVVGENWRLFAIILVLLILFVIAQTMAMFLIILSPVLRFLS